MALPKYRVFEGKTDESKLLHVSNNKDNAFEVAEKLKAKLVTENGKEIKSAKSDD